MRKGQLTIAALTALATFGIGASAIVAQPRAASTAPLFPLSDADLNATRESGCECSFRIGRRTLTRVIGNEIAIRTGGGRQVCRITDNQFSALTNGRGGASCGGLRISLRRTGPVRTMMESDSADWRAALTVSQGRTRRTLAGRYGCAC